MARRIRAAVAATLLFAALGLEGAGAQTPSPAGEDETITFTWGDTSEPSSLNPFRGYLGTDFFFWAWSYHLPIGFGLENLEAVPDFVTDTQVSEDGKVFT